MHNVIPSEQQQKVTHVRAYYTHIFVFNHFRFISSFGALFHCCYCYTVRSFRALQRSPVENLRNHTHTLSCKESDTLTHPNLEKTHTHITNSTHLPVHCVNLTKHYRDYYTV